MVNKETLIQIKNLLNTLKENVKTYQVVKLAMDENGELDQFDKLENILTSELENVEKENITIIDNNDKDALDNLIRSELEKEDNNFEEILKDKFVKVDKVEELALPNILKGLGSDIKSIEEAKKILDNANNIIESTNKSKFETTFDKILRLIKMTKNVEFAEMEEEEISTIKDIIDRQLSSSVATIAQKEGEEVEGYVEGFNKATLELIKQELKNSKVKERFQQIKPKKEESKVISDEYVSVPVSLSPNLAMSLNHMTKNLELIGNDDETARNADFLLVKKAIKELSGKSLEINNELAAIQDQLSTQGNVDFVKVISNTIVKGNDLFTPINVDIKKPDNNEKQDNDKDNDINKGIEQENPKSI